jgi:multicomponent Na+:H+ antiporter subunit G
VILEFTSWALILAGALLGIVGGIGIHRFPDFYSRMHAASTTDTLCAALFLLGLALQAGLSLVTFKLFLIFAFFFFTSPTASHALGKAALLGKLKPVLDDDIPAKTGTDA